MDFHATAELWEIMLAVFVASGFTAGYGYHLGRRDPLYRGKHR